MADNLKAAAFAAGLSDAQRREVEAINKTLSVHRELSNLPEAIAAQSYNSKTPLQQDALKKAAGEDAAPSRGWFGTTWHYTGNQVLKALTEAGDLTTRLYRTTAIANKQIPIGSSEYYLPKNWGVLADAWDVANDKGEKVLDQNRIEKARKRFGDATISVAIRVSAGDSLDKIITDATEEEKQVARVAQKGFKSETINGSLFQDALDAVAAAKYSPGRQVANALLPGQLEGSGLFYKPISGTVDLAFRVLADPTLILGKAKRTWDATKYALDVVIGKNTVEEVFTNPKVASFWNTYGAQVDELKKAKDAGDTVKAVAATNQLKILAPEFGPAVVKSLVEAEVPVTNALTAKAFFQNAKQTDEMMKGQIGRKRVLMPRLNKTRQARVVVATTANKIFNLDRMGAKFVDNLFFGVAATDDGIAQQLINGQKQIVAAVQADSKTKGVARFSMAMVQKRLDKFKAKFEAIPFFDSNVLDVTAKNAPSKIYQLARLTLPQRESKLIAQAFENSAVGRKKEIFYGLQGTILDLRGASATKEAREIAQRAQGKTNAMYAARNPDGYNPSVLPDGESIGLIPSDFSNFVTTLSVKDIDRLTARSGWIQRAIGVGHSDWVEKMTSLWSFGTLAGPRYALRNATEDLLVHLAIGESPWGLIKGRALSTRLRTARGVEKGLTRVQKSSANPLGSVIRFVNKKEADNYAAEIAAANGNIKVIREITATALNEGKMARFYGRVGLGKFSKEDKNLLAEQIRYGDLDNALMDVVEGAKNAFTGIDQYTKAIAITRRNKVRTAELQYDMGAGFKRAKGTKGFDEIKPDVVNEGSLVAWVMRIGYYANDALGGIAIANLRDEKTALVKIMKWMDEHPEIMSQARMEERGISQAEHAKRLYDSAKQLFVKRDGVTINDDLLSKVRTLGDDGEYRVAGKIGLDDLPINNADMPDYIIGPQLVSISDSGNYTSSLMEWGWDWLGNSNARLSREPMVLSEMIKLRKQFKVSGFDEAFIASYKKGITSESGLAKADIVARKKLAEIVEDRARLQILAYVDNPAVQTQFAFSIRNFARFYRATEDFYRRFYRTVRFNPESIRRASLTYEGITHSGWVQNDDQGQPYFIYPGTEHVYRVVQGVMQAFGVPAEFKVPMPVQFGAQIKMLTPSLNPESMVPTFAGPLSGISFKVAANLVDIFNPGAADTITKYTMGKYAIDQSFVSAFLPAHINRIYQAMGKDERDGQYASAMRKAMTYLEASGNGLEQKFDADGVTPIPPSVGDLNDYRERLNNITQSILGLRVVYGFVAPATASIQLKSEMSDWVRENGKANFKQVWYGLLDKTGDYDTAMKEWVRLFPDQIPFTISESERSTVAYFRYADESGKFVDENATLFKSYPQAASFLIPHKSGYSWSAYKTMTDMGLRRNKTVSDFLREVQTAADMQTYYAKKNEYETNLEAVGTDFERSQLRNEWTGWATNFKQFRPLVQEELSQGGKKAVERMKALNDLQKMLNDNNARKSSPKTFNVLKQMSDLYKSYKENADALDQFSGSQILKDSEKESTIIRMRELSQYNENTLSAYNVLFSRLLGD